MKPALLDNDAFKPAVLSCHDSFLVRQNETGQRPQQKAWALHVDYKTEMCEFFSCGCLQLRRKPTRNNLVNLQLQQAQVGDAQEQCSDGAVHLNADASSPPQASTRVTAPLLLSNFATFHSGQKCTQLRCKAGRPRKVPPARKLISSLLSDLQTFCQTSTKITFCRGPWTQY